MAAAPQIDYARLAKKYGGVEQVDYEALARKHSGRLEPEQETAPELPQGFLESVWQYHPINFLKQALSDPIATAKTVVGQIRNIPKEALGLEGSESRRMADESQAAYEARDYQTAIVKGYASFMATLPTGAAQAFETAAEQLSRRDVAGAVGTAYGYGGPMMAASPTRPSTAAKSLKKPAELPRKLAESIEGPGKSDLN